MQQINNTNFIHFTCKHKWMFKYDYLKISLKSFMFDVPSDGGKTGPSYT